MWQGGQPPVAKRSALSVLTPVASAPVDCTVCSRPFPRHLLMPLRPAEHDWIDYIRICYSCARNTTQFHTGRPITDQPIIASYVGKAMDNTFGTDSLWEDKFPTRGPNQFLEPWTSAIPSDDDIWKMCTNKQFKKDRWVLEWSWNTYEARWYRTVYCPELDPSDQMQELEQ